MIHFFLHIINIYKPFYNHTHEQGHQHHSNFHQVQPPSIEQVKQPMIKSSYATLMGVNKITQK